MVVSNVKAQGALLIKGVKIKREKTDMLTPNKQSATTRQIIKVYSASPCG
jgi:hypothetical protein